MQATCLTYTGNYGSMGVVNSNVLVNYYCECEAAEQLYFDLGPRL